MNTQYNNIQKINQYKTSFDNIVNKLVGDAGAVVEVLYVKNLHTVLGYVKWQNFIVAVNRTIDSCKVQSISVNDHFRDLTKMVMLDRESQRQ